MSECLVGVGANLGDPQQQLDRAIELLAACPAIRIKAQSNWMATLPVGGPAGQPAFLNGAVRLETEESPSEILNLLRRIEAQMGRLRGGAWGPRRIDLDLLLYDQRLVDEPELIVPHPWMMVRDFVLSPSCQIAGDWNHPVVQRSLEVLREQLHASMLPIAVISGSQPLWPAHRDLAHRAALASGFLLETVALPVPKGKPQPVCQLYRYSEGTRTREPFAIKSDRGNEPESQVGLCVCHSVEALLSLFSCSQSAPFPSTRRLLADPSMKPANDIYGSIRAAILLEDLNVTLGLPAQPPNPALRNPSSAASLQVARELRLPFVRIDTSNPSTALHLLQAAIEGVLAATPS